jgi:hypothetical protein
LPFHVASSLPLTKPVVWSCKPDKVASIHPKSGVAHAKAEGQATVTVTDPVSGAEAHAQLNVLNAQARPQVPQPGTLNEGIVRAMGERLQYLAQEKFMRGANDKGLTEPPPTAQPLKKTGDPQVDNLLSMAEGVVGIWNGPKLAPTARLIWRQIEPRFQEVLKQAASPKLGIDPGTLEPARQALARMTKYVNANLTSPERIEVRDVHRVPTPFGELGYYAFQEAEVLALFRPYMAMKSLFPTLTQNAKSMEQLWKVVENATKPPKDYLADIKAHVSQTVDTEADLFKVAANEVEIVVSQVRQFESSMRDAREQMDLAGAQIDAALMHQQAAEKHKRAEQAEAILDTGLSAVKAGLAFSLEGPAGVMELIDVVKDLKKLFPKTGLDAYAEALEEDAQKLDLKNARANLDQARARLADAEKFRQEAEKRVSEYFDDADRVRAKVEWMFDHPTGPQRTAAAFRFEDVANAADAVDAALELATQISLLAPRAAAAADDIGARNKKPLPRYPGVIPGYSDEGDHYDMRIIQAMQQDADKMGSEAKAQLSRANQLGTQLRTIRAAANKALYEAKDPRKWPKPKK